MRLRDGVILYHGSYTEIDSIDLSKCLRGKDFGKGFYLTTSKRQAASFIKTSLLKAKGEGRIPESQTHGYVTEYRFSLKEGIDCFEFEGVDKEWLYFICKNRRRSVSALLTNCLKEDYERYDIVIGKIANDDTNVTLDTFLAGTFGNIVEKRAVDFAISLLMPERLSDQACFKTKKSLECLEKVGATRYDI